MLSETEDFTITVSLCLAQCSSWVLLQCHPSLLLKCCRFENDWCHTSNGSAVLHDKNNVLSWRKCEDTNTWGCASVAVCRAAAARRGCPRFSAKGGTIPTSTPRPAAALDTLLLLLLCHTFPQKIPGAIKCY